MADNALDGNEHQMCSVKVNNLEDSGRRLAFVRFFNASPRNVDVIWINFNGGRVKYKTLEPKQFFDVNTYVAHPWVISWL